MLKSLCVVAALFLAACGVDGDSGADAGLYACDELCKDHGWVCDDTGVCQCDIERPGLEPMICEPPAE
jgi:hypothetical protein